MTEVIVQNPIKTVRKNVDQYGRLNVGKEFAGKEVEIILSDTQPSEDEPEE